MNHFGRTSVVVVCVATHVACNNAGSGHAAGESRGAASADAESSAKPNPVVGAAASPEAYHGRGVFYADAAIGCPHLGVGTRGDNACLRIALDDEHSSAEIDRAHNKIVLHNDGTYKSEQIVADVILPGWTESIKGRAPTSVHCVLRKNGTTYSTKIYAHPVHREKHTKVDLENLEVVLNDGKTDTVLLSAAEAQKAAADPGPMAKLAGFFTEVTDTLPASAPSEAGAKESRPVGDITLAIGVGPAAEKAVHAQLFRTGADTELRLTALSNIIPTYMVQRDLFLYGLEGASNLGEVKKRGLESGETLSLAVHGGKGSVSFGGTTVDLPDAANSMHDFLTTAFVGMVLAYQAKLDTAAPSPPATTGAH